MICSREETLLHNQSGLDSAYPVGVYISMDKTIAQLNRIQGQLQGVAKMYQDEATCVEVVRQIIAARNSLTSVARNLLNAEAKRCQRERRIEDLDAILQEVFKY